MTFCEKSISHIVKVPCQSCAGILPKFVEALALIHKLGRVTHKGIYLTTLLHTGGKTLCIMHYRPLFGNTDDILKPENLRME